jgi:HEAT repeat protein
MHETYCMNCFSMMPRGAAVCPSCGKEIVALTSRGYREKLLRALHHPLAEVRMRAVIALGLQRDTEAADDLVACALRHPKDVIEALEIVRSLRMFPAGRSRHQALHDLSERHPAAVVRIAAMAAIAGTPWKESRH